MFITKTNEAFINPVLTKLALAYPQQGLVADKLAPKVDVGEGNEDGTYFEFDKSNLQEGIEDIRALGARATTYDWMLSLATYHCDEHTLEKSIDWREFKKYKKYLDVAVTTQEITLELLLLNYEIRVASLFTTIANYATSGNTTALAGATMWSDFVNSDPEGAIETAREAIALGAAEPNTIAIPVTVWRTLRRHPAIRSLMKEPDSRLMTDDGFPKRLFGLNAVFPGARQNITMPRVAENITRVWGNNVWIGIVNPRPSKRTMSFAYTFITEGMKVETYEDKPKKSDVLRIQHQISAEKILTDYAGYLYTNVI
ncbi:hypothetical protein KKH23_04225 [Patescibacteria group bacterium]|nr:hypothetical protein [Patescibacteria group bacterium]